MATASSGLIDRIGYFPPKNYLTISTTFGILEDPPTRTISQISSFFTPESLKIFSIGGIISLNKGRHIYSSLALLITIE